MAKTRVTSKEEELWNSEAWLSRRTREQSYYDWYSGKKLAQAVSQTETDSDTGQPVSLYPLELNPIAEMCRKHRSVTIGIADDFSEMPIKMVFQTKDEARKDAAEEAQDFVNEVWYQNNGASLIPEGVLMANVHGGYFFRVKWDKNNDLLPYRIAIEAFQSPYIYPLYDAGDFWNLREVYIGYTISGEDALARYGIGEENQDSLYMEHWTRDSYTVTVDGIVPEVDGQRLEGEHSYGRVPGVYIAHYRDGSFWGPSQVKDLIGLTIEKNARAADKGDVVQETTHPTLVASNIRSTVTQLVVETNNSGNPTKTAVNIGSAQNTPGSHEPKLEYTNTPNLPDSVMGFDGELTAAILRQADVAPVLVGIDDTAQGRITGPVSNMRAISTVQHCQGERVEWAMGMKHLADIILRIAESHGAEYRTLKVDAPQITARHRQFKMKTIWPPMLPLEETERVTTLNSRLQVGGISLVEYLIAFHDNDPEGHAKQIWKDKQRQAEIDATAEVLRAKIQAEAQQANAQAQLDMQRQRNDQQMQFAQERHGLQMKQQQQRAAQRQPRQE